MSLREREWLLNAENQQPIANTSTPPDAHDFASCTIDVDTMLPPPGEEGFSLKQITTGCPRRLDLRDRSGRIAQQLADWSTQYDDLTDALLNYRHHHTHQTMSSPATSDSSFSIEVVDIFDRTTRTFNHVSPFINATLLQYGCIGSSPLRPTIAITIRTLDVFRQTHRVCPRYSINAEAKKLAFLHNVCYRRHLAEQLRVAYDVYLELERRVESRLQAALGHNTPNWRMLNSCPACQYKVVGEPPLEYLVLCALDGNNSAKLIDPAIHGGNECFDPRCGLSSIWLTETYVDQFKDEVQRSRHMQDQRVLCDPDDPWIDEPDSGDSSEPSTVCVDRWRNAAPESHKKMFAIFKRSGIFITVCQHGFLLTICDMVRSGELMKYPIASIRKLMDVFGSNILYSYDIKCAFEKIIMWSSLANDAKRLNLQGVVPAFHGHAHNHLCQVEHHSKYRVGAGKEDFETCERVFSGSNALTGEIHNASDFHRHQALDEYFCFQDMDQYAALSDFIYQNYVQALNLISTTTSFLINFRASHPEATTPFEDDLQDELSYLKHYVKALNKYEEAQDNYEVSRVEFSKLDLCPIFSAKDTANIRWHHTHTATKRDQKLEVVMDYKQQMALDVRWGKDHPEHLKAQSRITHHLYHKAVDDVEYLVVMRLLELTKLQMSGLGYKLRTQISTVLKSRANAIRNALQRYNKYAAQLYPPRPLMQWEQIVEYSFLAEFDLLRELDGTIQAKHWANPAYRHASTQYFEQQRANEEIHQLNVEVGHLLTKIRDQAIDYPLAISRLTTENPPLASELHCRWAHLRAINACHLLRIHQIQCLPGYTGPMSAGMHEGRVVPPQSPPLEYCPTLEEKIDEGEGHDNDEDLGQQQLEHIHHYIEGLDHHLIDSEVAA
ncbi:uncharacterized protein HD556DRAFT_1440267 [Suillus plorans]|uniref:CxC1-like cysteine cluster associated with KDZ transposases domain-containing protein n=1 Tax=Suillus plorans TaxID=116603 RepID=A0A9P7J0Z4_9AGAM|nr:uncharacterized protein HD556DRAFT_1440267 [Suillus plorans]KAG1798562.1 hypothetical protein HD556DRAFT_1440267 [Suillus plorans]